ncbi:hypothetical protein HDR60_02265, partial [bacterium]|nr:hypothetical protein [bacterium]
TCNSGYTKKGDNCCANAPANATLNTNDCGWTCNSGYSKNAEKTGCQCASGTITYNNKCVKLSDLKESDFTQVTSASVGNCVTGTLSSGVYMVKLRGGKGGKGYGNSNYITQENAKGTVFQLTESETYNLCAGKDGTDGTEKQASTGGFSSHISLKTKHKFYEVDGSNGSPSTKCSSSAYYDGWCSDSPKALDESYKVCSGYINRDNICCYKLIGTPGRNECTISNIKFAASGGGCSVIFGGLGGSSYIDFKTWVTAASYFDGGSGASKISDTISVQNCDGPCAILYKLK